LFTTACATVFEFIVDTVSKKKAVNSIELRHLTANRNRSKEGDCSGQNVNTSVDEEFDEFV